MEICGILKGFGHRQCFCFAKKIAYKRDARRCAHEHVCPGASFWPTTTRQERQKRRARPRFDRHDVQPRPLALRRPLHRDGSDRRTHREVDLSHHHQ